MHPAHRPARTSTAVTEGCLATPAPFIIVMDADLQHDEAAIPSMIEHLASPSCDLVVATRYAEGGSTGDWNRTRKTGSRMADLDGPAGHFRADQRSDERLFWD